MTKRQILILTEENNPYRPPNITNAVNQFINEPNITVIDIKYNMSSNAAEGYLPTVVHSVYILFDSCLDDFLIEDLKQKALRNIYYKEV